MAATAATETPKVTKGGLFGLFRKKTQDQTTQTDPVDVRIEVITYHRCRSVGEELRYLIEKFFKEQPQIRCYLKATAVATLGVAIRCLLNRII